MLFEGATELFFVIPLLTINYFYLYTQKENTILNAYLFNISLYIAFSIELLSKNKHISFTLRTNK